MIRKIAHGQHARAIRQPLPQQGRAAVVQHGIARHKRGNAAVVMLHFLRSEVREAGARIGQWLCHGKGMEGCEKKKAGKAVWQFAPGPAKAGGPKAVLELFWVDFF